MDDLYREIIIEHYKNPLHKGRIENSDYTFEDENPLCGDHLQIELRVNADQKVVDAKFDGQGCAISISAADLLLDSIIGKSIEDLKALSKKDILDLLGIELSPVRLKCALLSLKVLKAAVYELQEADDDLIQK
ncbi:MAG: SUF system NifU family Fe-S cluster assembly protein [Pelolinea sp.]|nr:SUF system NifU family Fe-S cluster assembly protein [Pelolinea sp.]